MSSMEDITAQIEAILFFKNEPVTRKWLGTALGAPLAEIDNGLISLKEKLNGRGVLLLEKDDEVALRTAPDYSPLLQRIRKEELSKDLGKAGLETLSIVLYRGPVTRGEIDFIRGVNSTFIIRSLLVRGLVERIPNPKDMRGFLYRPTVELFSFLGISAIDELPEYKEVREEMKLFETEHKEHGE
ncbi:SMC-Scp complex subunit ScpB [Candidatus Kaiserbacteria bacterium]|nr:SMC-Scp complex subunit ScpB [Candidatus Kaiserbacteria bacterium]